MPSISSIFRPAIAGRTVLLFVLLLSAGALVTPAAAFADPSGTVRLQSSGTASVTDGTVTWNYDLTWRPKVPPTQPGLTGVTAATVTGSFHVTYDTAYSVVWQPPPDFGEVTVVCHTVDDFKWSGAVSAGDPNLYFDPAIEVGQPEGGLRTLNVRMWLTDAVDETKTTTASSASPFCFPDVSTARSNYHVSASVGALQSSGEILQGTRTVGFDPTAPAGYWSPMLTAEGPATISYNLTGAEPATLEVRKVLRPATDPGRFDLLVDGAAMKANAGDGDTTGPISLAPGTHTVAEASGLGSDGLATHLDRYTSAIGCVDRATGEGVTSSAGPGPLNVPIPAGGDLVCTVTNYHSMLIIEKQTIPDGIRSPYEFTGAVAGSISDDQTLTESVTPGAHTVRETRASNSELASITCNGTHVDDLPNQSVTVQVGAGETVRCVFTNRALCVGEYTQRAYAGKFYSIEEELLPWEASVRWCHDGTSTMVQEMHVTGDVPRTITFGLLEQIGLSFSYNPELSHIDALDPAPRPDGSTVVGAELQFDMCVNWGTALLSIVPGGRILRSSKWLKLTPVARHKILLGLKTQFVAFVRRFGQVTDVFKRSDQLFTALISYIDINFALVEQNLINGIFGPYCTPVYTPVLRLTLLPGGGVITDLQGAFTRLFRTVIQT